MTIVNIITRATLATAIAITAVSAHAQYARPGSKPVAPPTAPAKPGAPAPAPAPAPATSSISAAEAGGCIEPMDMRDAALIRALSSNGLLCPTQKRAGTPVRIRGGAGGELIGEENGAPTAWIRDN